VESHAAAADPIFASTGSNTWNYLAIDPFDAATTNPSFSNLVDSAGSATGVAISFTGNVSAANDEPVDNNGSDALENEYFLICGSSCGTISASVTYTISGLPANTVVAFYLYSPNFTLTDSGDPVGVPNRGYRLTANSVTVDVPSGYGTNDALAYVTTDASGNISGTWSVPNGNEGDWSGFQIGYPAVARTVSHDFDGDRKSDVLWRNSNGAVEIWKMNGIQTPSYYSGGSATTDWHIIGAGDFDGEGHADILWHNNNGQVAVWLMDNSGLRTMTKVVGTATAPWTFAGIGDFDGDGKADILWRNTTTGAVVIWKMDGVAAPKFLNAPSATTDWLIEGVGDLDGDGKSDILWRNTNGAVAVWLMNGAVRNSAKTIGSATSDWTIAGTGDFDGDRKTDILWRQTSTGNVVIWKMNGVQTPKFLSAGTATTDWQVAGTGDFDGDGNADILWRNTNGAVAIWLMNGAVRNSAKTIGSATSDWQIQPE